jgi:hypothetical protein
MPLSLSRRITFVDCLSRRLVLVVHVVGVPLPRCVDLREGGYVFHLVFMELLRLDFHRDFQPFWNSREVENKTEDERRI